MNKPDAKLSNRFRLLSYVLFALGAGSLVLLIALVFNGVLGDSEADRISAILLIVAAMLLSVGGVYCQALKQEFDPAYQAAMKRRKGQRRKRRQPEGTSRDAAVIASTVASSSSSSATSASTSCGGSDGGGI